MKNFKRFLAVVLAVMFVVTSAAISISAGSNSKAWYKEAVEYLDELTISNIGTTADQELSREEFVTWVAKLESHQLNENGWLIWEYTANATFSDVEESDHLGAIGWSVNRGFIVGNNDGTDTTLPTFAPDRTVSLAEAAAVVVRMMGYTKSVPGDTSNWAVNNIHVANTLCKAFDETFLTEVGTFDPDYKLTKGEGAYILYTIMNGKYHSKGESTTDANTGKLKSDVITTYNGVDLGEWFASASNTTVKLQVMVTDLPMAVSNSGAMHSYIYQRFDAVATGVNAVKVATSYTGWLDTSDNETVSLATVGSKKLPSDATATMDSKVFNALIRKTLGLGDNDTTTNILEYVEIGSVITLKMTKKQYETLAGTVSDDAARAISMDDVTKGLVTATLNNTYVADTYIGTTAQASVDVRKGNSLVGWTAASAASSANSAYARISTNYLNWTNIVYNKDGSLKSADLVVGDQTYKVVTEYTGAANEILVYAPAGIIDSEGNVTLSKTIVSVVGNAGDVVYAGAELDSENYNKLIAASKFADTTKYTLTEATLTDGKYIVYKEMNGTSVVAENVKFAKMDTTANTYTLVNDVALTSYSNSLISYNFVTEAGALVTHQGLALVSELFADGSLNKAIDTSKALTVAQAYELILAPAQGECNVVLSDVDGDGIYDIAVVTESTRALYYGNVNASENPGSYGDLDNRVTNTIFDSFGNYVTSTAMLKGMGVGGLVIDKTVSAGSNTDSWSFSNVSTDTIQLVVVGSNERRAFSTTTQAYYGIYCPTYYDVVDVAELTTAYIKEVSAYTTIVDGVACYKAVVIDSANKASTVYIPAVIEDQITLDVTVDDITSKVTFNCGADLLSFANGHVSTGVGNKAVIDSSAWMTGHTVKYVVDEDTNIAWCMVDTIEEDAVSGYVVSVEKALKDNEGNNTYKITLATTSNVGSSTTSYKAGELTAEIANNIVIEGAFNTMGWGTYGLERIVNPTAEVKVYVITEKLADLYKTESNFADVVLKAANGYNGLASDTAQWGNGTNTVVGITGLFNKNTDGSYVYAPSGEVNYVSTYRLSGNNNTLFTAGTIISEYDYNNFVNSDYKNSENEYFKEVPAKAWQTWVAHDLGANVVFADGTYYSYNSSDLVNAVSDTSVQFSVKLGIEALTNYYNKLTAGTDTDTLKLTWTGDSYSKDDTITIENYRDTIRILELYGYVTTEKNSDGDFAKATVVKDVVQDETVLKYSTYLNYVGADTKLNSVESALEGIYEIDTNGDYVWNGVTVVETAATALGIADVSKLEANKTVLLTAAKYAELKANSDIITSFKALFNVNRVKFVVSELKYNEEALEETNYFNPVFYLNTGFTKSETNYEKSTTVATYTVKGSATSIWNYDAATYNTIHNLLVNGNVDSFSTTNSIGAVKADDILYITLAKDAGDYYTIQGVDTAATNNVVTGSAVDNNNTSSITDAGKPLAYTGWRAYSAYNYISTKYDIKTVGAGVESQWKYYDTDNYSNEHVLGYTVIKDASGNESTVDIMNNGVKSGYYKLMNMYIGVNPYYERVANGNNYTFELKFTGIKMIKNIRAEYAYSLDLDKTIVYKLYYAGTENQLVDTNGDYAKLDGYYVDPTTNYVYRVDSDKAVYNTSKATFIGYTTKNSDGTEFNDIETTWVNNYTVKTVDKKLVLDGEVSWGISDNKKCVLFSDAAVVCGLKSEVTEYASLTLKAYTADENGYVPGKYHAYIDTADGNTKSWNMSETTKIVVITPNAETGKLDIKYTTGKALYESESTLFVTGYQTVDDSNNATITMISVIGKINGKPADVVVDPSDTSKDTVSKGTKLVYLGAGSNIVADMGETDNLWVVKSESSAYDVTTGKEIGSIQITYNMYLDKNQTSATLTLAAGGYYLVDANNEVIVAVDDTKVGTYGSAKTGLAEVKTGTITDANNTGKTIATIDGKKDVDVSNYTFKFIYHDIGERVEGGYAYGDNFGIGGSNTGVTLNTEKQIADTWSSYEEMIDDYNGENKNEYTKEEYEAALEAIEAAKEAAVGSYLNGTFWNVAYSPAYRYVQNQLISFQAKSAEINFNYVVIDDVYYVFVNTFAK